jgi:hypothetical protein
VRRNREIHRADPLLSRSPDARAWVRRRIPQQPKPSAVAGADVVVSPYIALLRLLGSFFPDRTKRPAKCSNAVVEC